MKKVRRFFEGDEVDTSSRGAAGTSETTKSRVVSKKELEASGYDNLRDYLNAQRGLTRRKEKDPTAGDSPDKAAQEAADAIDPGRETKPVIAKQKPATAAPTATASVNKPKSSRVPSPEEASANRGAVLEKIKNVGSSISDYFSNYKTPAERRNQERKEKTVGMKSGGSVSSASRRGDGIAQRGKTRGKMY
jgi:hypothetical protein